MYAISASGLSYFSPCACAAKMRRAGLTALRRVPCTYISSLAREQLLGPQRIGIPREGPSLPPRHDYVDEMARPLNKSQTVVETLRNTPLCTELLLNLPQNDNRMDLETSKDLLAALREKRDGRALKALLLRGVGSTNSNYFCGGHDWAAIREHIHNGKLELVDETIRKGLQLVFFTASSSSHYLTSASLPFLMGIVNGRTEGFGTSLALFTDFMCATRGTELTFTGPEYGLPAHGGHYRLLVPCNKKHPGHSYAYSLSFLSLFCLLLAMPLNIRIDCL